MKRTLLPLFLITSFAISACSDDKNPESTENSAAADFSCVPDEATWEQEIRPLVEANCGSCHGESPDYGAPNTLTSYDGILTAKGKFRDVDSIAARVADGTMPPIGMPAISQDAAQKIVDWASCGTLEASEAERLTVSRPVYLPPAEAPSDWEFVDLTAGGFEVAQDVSDLYQCFTFESPFDADRFIRRIEVVLDRSEVLHHAVFLRDPEKNAPLEPHECVGMPQGSDYLYAWAPGAGAVQFPDGGMRIKPGEQFVLQIHYNNGARLENVSDSSGIRLYHGPPEGSEYGMTAPGPLVFQVPGRTVENVTGRCTISEDWTLLAGMPHMHEIGKEFYQTIKRADGTTEELISLKNWEFESQLFYELPVTLGPGDVIETTCVFDNPDVGMVTAGARTQDEMCFNFIYVTPPPSARYCDEYETEEIAVEYTPGECAPEGALEAPEQVTGSFVVGEPPALNGGALEEGVYALKDIEIWRESDATPVGPLDVDASQIATRGQFIYSGGEFTFDASITSEIVIETGQALQQNNTISFRGVRDESNTDLITGEAVCGQASGEGIAYEQKSPTELHLGVKGSAFGTAFESRYVLSKAGE